MDPKESYPEVVSGLATVRPDMALRWNPTAVLIAAGEIDAEGRVSSKPKYEPRWEVWDKDPQGAEYMIMRLQTETGEFRQPGSWLIERMQYMNPERWGGVEKMMEELVEKPNILREAGTKKDSDDLIEAIGNAAAWHAMPKSYAGQTYRGGRILSGTLRSI